MELENEVDDNAEPEWVECEPPILLRKDVAVACPICDSVNLLKHHMPRSGFSFECPACRRRATMRKIQKAYRVRKEKQSKHATAKLNSDLIVRLSRDVNYNNQRITAYQRRVASGKPITVKAKDRQIERLVMAEFYQQVKVQMLKDIRLGRPQMYLSYINNDKLLRTCMENHHVKHA